MAWLRAGVLGALLTLCAGQFPIGDSANFDPFTNFDQYSQNRARSANSGARPASQRFGPPASHERNYEVSRSFNFDRQSLNGAPIDDRRFPSSAIGPSRYTFDEGRQVRDPIQDGSQYRGATFTPTTERPRYYEPPYQKALSPRHRALLPTPVQNQRPPTIQYAPQSAPVHYQSRPAPLQFQPAVEPAAQSGYVPPQVGAQVYGPKPRAYPALVQKIHQTPIPTQAPYRPAAPPGEQYRPPRKIAPVSNWRSTNEITAKPAVVHQAAPVHYVSIGQKLEGDYKFGYDTGKDSNGDESFRRETRDPEGTVRGSYGYVDSNGKKIVVHYEAGKDGYKVLSESEAKRKAEQAQRAVAQPHPAPQVPFQQYQVPVQQPHVKQALQGEEVPRRRLRRVRKKKREKRAVETDDEENVEKKNFGSRVSGTGSLRPTGSPRSRLQRTRRPLNPDGRSLRPTDSPIGERGFRKRVVQRTTTPLPQLPARPTVPRRKVIPTVPAVTPPSFEEPVVPPQRKRRRKIRRKLITTVAPELQQLQAPIVQTAATVPIAPVATQTPSAQLPVHVFPPSPPQTPLANQTNFFSSYNNIATHHTSNPHVQHVNSPQSLYDQVTSSIYQEAGRVPPSRSFAAHFQNQQHQPAYQSFQFGSGNFQPQYITPQMQYAQLPQYQHRDFQLPQQQFQQNRFQPSYTHPRGQDLYSYPSNVDYSQNFLSYDIRTPR